MTIRKNFLLDEEIVEHLKEIAKANNTTQTQVIRNMIEEQYQEIEMQKRLEAFHRLTKSIEKSGDNPFLKQFAPNDHKVVQKIKAMMHE
jgi:predicted DNA-binding protein